MIICLSRCAVYLCSVVLLLAGCSPSVTIQGGLPHIKAVQSPAQLRAGAAKVDITPPPGIPMGGHANAGKVARGHWLRLQARSLYIQTPNGSRLALLAADLWSMPAGLADRVTELLSETAPQRCRLKREQIVIAATHTHQSPGNFSSASLYNQFASKRPGFDQDLFAFLAGRLATVLRESCMAAEPARLTFKTTRVKQLARNRSIEAFLSNKRCKTCAVDQILGAGRDLAGSRAGERNTATEPKPDPIVYKAVDPQLQSLWITRADDPGHVLAVAAFTAVHPTALKHVATVYSSDLFGVAAMFAEQQLGSQTGEQPPVVAIFNGAEGDVSPDWFKQDRDEVVTLGERLGAAITRLQEPPGLLLDDDIRLRFSMQKLAGQQLGDEHTLQHFKAGAAALGGAEDGRSWLYGFGCHEGNDYTIMRPLCSFIAGVGNLYTRWFLSVPEAAPMGVYTLGPVVIATLPGEFTTVMGRRIRNSLARQFAPDGSRQIVLVGLANEYVSYFTTPEEYAAQHYEGGSMMYGALAGQLVAADLTAMAASFDDHVSQPGRCSYSYNAGKARQFSPEDLTSICSEHLLQEVKSSLLLSRLPERKVYQQCWHAPASPLAEINHERTVAPSVVVEKRQPDGSWQPLLDSDGVVESDQGKNFVVLLSRWQSRESEWCAFWMPVSVPPSGLLRLHVTGQEDQHYILPAFDPAMPARKAIFKTGKTCKSARFAGMYQGTE